MANQSSKSAKKAKSKSSDLISEKSTSKKTTQKDVIFDVMYGFIPITEWEAKIINSPFFQRLRWIKQLGFSNYIFPGAEHNRFAHVIGVMHSMDQMINALGINVSQAELFNPKSRSKAAMLHKSLRIAALLHDIGTFPFSHAIEYAYMRQGNVRTDRKTKSGGIKAPKELSNNHEHLGAFIIKNTRYEGGLTAILEEYGFDVLMISKIIKGESPDLIANQLMHSDLDADRMDYLLRDAHYTGIKYGQFDREYILANLVTYVSQGGQTAFGVKENAAHAVEDFLIARFSWYSQVIKNQASAKFDIMASHVAKGLLEEDLMFQFHDLLTMIEERDERFFWWNDLYFMERCQKVYFDKLCKSAKTYELIKMLLYRKAPKSVRHPAFEHRIINDDLSVKTMHLKQIHKTVAAMNECLEKYGTGKEWLLVDIPTKDVIFTKGLKRLGKGGMQNYEPIKVVGRDGKASLLVERSNSLMKHLSHFMNFVPNVYANEAGLELLKKKKLL
jgi:HD superfamily phosphohydrolase